MDFSSLLPADIPLTVSVGLIIFSFFTSSVTAAFGIGGGIMMLAAIASFLPALAIIPTHGAVQFGSNIGRTFVFRREVEWPLFFIFFAGALLGGVVAAQVVVSLPRDVLRLVLGFFVLWSVWGPRLGHRHIDGKGFAAVGALSTFATMFIGATGPLIAACLPTERMNRQQVIGTHAACMTVQHAIKVGVFIVIGFNFPEWLGLILLMIASGFLGTLAGRKLLDRIPETWFRIGFKAILTLVAIRLVILSVTEVFPGLAF